jgi:hypothetical protein
LSSQVTSAKSKRAAQAGKKHRKNCSKNSLDHDRCQSIARIDRSETGFLPRSAFGRHPAPLSGPWSAHWGQETGTQQFPQQKSSRSLSPSVPLSIGGPSQAGWFTLALQTALPFLCTWYALSMRLLCTSGGFAMPVQGLCPRAAHPEIWGATGPPPGTRTAWEVCGNSTARPRRARDRPGGSPRIAIDRQGRSRSRTNAAIPEPVGSCRAVPRRADMRPLAPIDAPHGGP